MIVTPIVTERLRLRQWRDSDLAAFAELNADPEVMRYYPSVLERAASDALAIRARAELERNGFGLWAVEASGVAEFVGYVGLSHPGRPMPFTSAERPPVEVGWRLARAFWGRGYATEAARAALAFGFTELALAEIVSFTAVVNERSRAVMERLAMKRRAEDDFDHPALPDGHPLRRHVLHRMTRSDWLRRSSPS